jgi:hypothetical protein
MTKLDSKYLKELIMEVMKVGDYELNKPSSIPNIDKKFSYDEPSIPVELRDAVLQAFSKSLGEDAIADLMKISGKEEELDWEDFYAILLDPKTLLRQPALAAMRMVKDQNADYAEAFDAMLKKIISDKPVREPAEVNPYAVPIEDIVARESSPPPEYIREAFEILGLNAFETLQERLKKLSDFSKSVVNNEYKGTSIRETFSNIIVLNALSTIVRSMDAISAGFKFEDFLGLLSSGVAIGEGMGASDDVLGILSDPNGEFSQFSSAKFYNSWSPTQAIKTISMAMPGQDKPENLEDLEGFDVEEFDADELKRAKKAYEQGETEKLIQIFKDAGVDPKLIDKIKQFKIPKYDPSSDSSIEKKTKSALGRTPDEIQKAAAGIDYGNKTITYVIGVKLGKDAAPDNRSTRVNKGEPKPVLATGDIPLEKVDIHIVTIKRTRGKGIVKPGDLEAVETGAQIGIGKSVSISGLGPNTRVGQLLLADSTESLVKKSNEAMNSVEKNIPIIIKALATFSEKTKATLISGKEEDINETTRLYTEMFGLINEILYGTDVKPSAFAKETGFQAGVKTSGDTIVQKKATKITP